MRCAENQTRNSSLFLETQKSKPYPSPKIKIQNLDEKEVSDQRCPSHAISDSLTQWPPIHQTNSPSTLLLLLSCPPDCLEEEEEEEPNDEAFDQPSITTINSNAKYDNGTLFFFFFHFLDLGMKCYF